MFQWVDYESKYALLVDSWLDEEALDLTGIDDGWDQYWLAVKADAVNFPGCEDFCKIIYDNSVPFAAVCYGFYQNTVTVSEVVVDPKCRRMGKGSLMLRELIYIVIRQWPNAVHQITAVIYLQNSASQRAFQKAGFHLQGKTEDGVDLIYSFTV